MNDANDRRQLFLGCFIALIATAFGFVVRGGVLNEWREQFNLSNEQVGWIQGAGLYPFAISIVLFSLIVDKIGYGRTMVFAFIGHVASAIITIFAKNFEVLYFGTFLFALANGAVEAVINPVVATIYDKNKTHWLNILHAGWPGGMVLGGLLAILLGAEQTLGSLPGHMWQWKMALVLIPTVIYGMMLIGKRFPVQERVAAGVSFMDMLREFGWGSCYIVSFLLVAGINQVLVVAGVKSMSPEIWAAIAVVPTILFAFKVPSFGRPMFVFLLLIMILLATTELGVDSWIQDIMGSVLNSPKAGTLVLIYTAVIMFVLRFFAGPIVHRISPLGLLAVCALLAAFGLIWLSKAGDAVGMVFAAATLYGVGKTFYWPTTLGVVSEQYPKGGALMLNAIAGVGMIAVGTLGNPGIGYFQDQTLDRLMHEQAPALQAEIIVEKPSIFGTSNSIDEVKREKLSPEQNKEVKQLVVKAQQQTLLSISVLPFIMFVCYMSLIIYFRSKGGYKAQVLTGHSAQDEKFTGGVVGPVEG